jgi:hypothetical protein
MWLGGKREVLTMGTIENCEQSELRREHLRDMIEFKHACYVPNSIH